MADENETLADPLEAANAVAWKALGMELSGRVGAVLKAPIWVDPNRMGGAPCITGTRITTAAIAEMAWRFGVDEVSRSWPLLFDFQIHAALWWEWQSESRQTKRGAWAYEARGILPNNVAAHLAKAPTQGTPPA